MEHGADLARTGSAKMAPTGKRVVQPLEQLAPPK